MYKERKLIVSVNDFTYPSLNKAVQQKNIEVNKNLTSESVQENISKKSCNKNVTNNYNVSSDITNVLSHNITMKTIDQKEITKDKLGVTALIAIM